MRSGPFHGGKFLWLLALAAFLSARVQAADLPPDAATHDPRILKAVSVRSREMRIEELLAEFRRQTGVAIRCSTTRDLAGQFRVVVSLHETPLKDALSALWSLMSHETADWHWEVLTRKGVREYVLFRPQKAQTFPARLLEEAQLQFEANAEKLIAAAEASPAVRAKMAETNPFLKSRLANETTDRTWMGIRAFAETVPSDKRKALMRGRKLRVPFDQLGPIAQSYVRNERSVLDAARAKRGFGPTPVPFPTWIEYDTMNVGRNTPSMFCVLEGIGGYATFGGVPLSVDFNEFIKKLWMRPGDVEGDPRESQLLRVAEPETAAIASSAYRLNQVADASPLSYLAFAVDDRKNPRSPNGMTLGAYLEDFSDLEHGYPHKWRNKILLIEGTHWYWRAVPYPPAQRTP